MRDPWLSQHTVLAGIVLGNSGILLRGTKIDKKSVWYIPMYMVSAFVFVHLAMGGNLMPELEPGLHTVPVTAFALMLLSEFSAFIFNSVIDVKFTMGYFRVPAMTVHMIALLHYMWEPEVSTRQLDIFGRPLSPLRYVMWILSVSNMCISIFLVVRNVLAQPAKGCMPWRLEDASKLHAQLVRTLFAVLGVFVLGYYALDPSLSQRLPAAIALLPNFLAMVGSFAAFYYLLYNLDNMLWRAQTHPLLAVTRIGAQFKIVRVAVLIAWHIFPVVWLLAAANVVSVASERIGYVIGDLVAKYLLLFVYVTAISND